MSSPDWIKYFPELSDNPFAKGLPPVPTAIECYNIIARIPNWSKEELSYPAHIRYHLTTRVLQLVEPSTRQIELMWMLRSVIHNGYIHRNPLSSENKRKLIDSSEDLEKVRRGTKYHDVYPEADPTGGIPGFSLLGCPGMGKTLTFDRILANMPQLIVHSQPITLYQIVWLKIECPTFGSVKTICLNIIEQIAKITGDKSVTRSAHGKNQDQLMIYVQHLLRLYGVGVIVIDEIQNVVTKKSMERYAFINYVVTLSNHLGLPIIFVGTATASDFLQKTFGSARRANGLGSLYWDRMEKDADWSEFVEQMWKFNWCSKQSELTQEIEDVIYDESQGIISVAVNLFVMTQMRIILRSGLSGSRSDDIPESIDPCNLRRVAKEKFGLIKPMIEALRTNDIDALVKFNDLKPLDDIMQLAIAHVDGAGEFGRSPDMSMVREASRAERENRGDDDALGIVLQLSHTPKREWPKILKEVRRVAPSLDLPSMLKGLQVVLRSRNCLERVRLPGPFPANSRDESRDRESDGSAGQAATGEVDSGDLRALVAAGSGLARSAYDVLVEAGVVKDAVTACRR